MSIAGAAQAATIATRAAARAGEIEKPGSAPPSTAPSSGPGMAPKPAPSDSGGILPASLAPGVHVGSLQGMMDSVQQQYDQLGKDLSNIGKAKGALQTIGATFAFLTSIEQMVSAPIAAIPFPGMPA